MMKIYGSNFTFLWTILGYPNIDFLKKNNYRFFYVDLWISVHHMHAMPKESRRGRQISLELYLVARGLEPEFSGRAARLLTAEPSRLPPTLIIKSVFPSLYDLSSD